MSGLVVAGRHRARRCQPPSSTTPASRLPPARSPPCSGPTAPASRPCCARSPASSARPPGSVVFDGDDLLALPRRERARRLALVEQEAGTELPLTVRVGGRAGPDAARVVPGRSRSGCCADHRGRDADRRRGRVRRPGVHEPLRGRTPARDARAGAGAAAPHPVARRADESPGRVGAARGARPAGRARRGRHDGRRGAARSDARGRARGCGGRHVARPRRRERPDREDAHAEARARGLRRRRALDRQPAHRQAAAGGRATGDRAAEELSRPDPSGTAPSATRAGRSPAADRGGPRFRRSPSASRAARSTVGTPRPGGANADSSTSERKPAIRSRSELSTTASRSAKSRGVSLSGAAQPKSRAVSRSSAHAAAAGSRPDRMSRIRRDRITARMTLGAIPPSSRIASSESSTIGSGFAASAALPPAPGSTPCSSGRSGAAPGVDGRGRGRRAPRSRASAGRRRRRASSSRG